MATRIHRSTNEPIRQALDFAERWRGPDKGLILCWENGRQLRSKDAELSAKAENGELVMLEWKGGVEGKLKMETKPGTLSNLATWQGLRGEDLNISWSVICCSAWTERTALIDPAIDGVVEVRRPVLYETLTTAINQIAGRSASVV
jgi:hypothetical protein